MVEIKAVPILRDNYVWVLEQQNSNKVVVLDPGEVQPVIAHLEAHQQRIGAIVITHRHWDHTDGINGLTEYYQCPVYGPDTPAIPQVSHALQAGELVSPIHGISLRVMSIPGHTEIHFAYILQQADEVSLFCGDTLFSAGCGRLLGGTAAQFKTSLDTIAELPVSTRIYCTHEYTLANLAFAAAVMPSNRDVPEYTAFVEQRRARDEPSLPTTLELELKINPFLRCGDKEVIASVEKHFSTHLSNELEVFTRLRQYKDTY
ncbi:hydroxyacylglutathione hydrolase [Teredinibacter franksiae]|uniref:hydroxyacylglutathione hydrolase n=1 Tax=Teredinibacter franksiae TaxID=2761453 RepID=UPI001628AAC6|nr:hydroxyacylglutathione hydrolase [Teredinibacter franksiae]